MRRFMMLAGLALVASLALAGATAVSASAALPEFRTADVRFLVHLEKLLTGAPVGRFFVKPAGVTIECWLEHAEGLTLLTGVHKVLITYRMCIAKGNGKTCNVLSPGAARGEVMTVLLDGRLGYINKPIKETGLLLLPSSGTSFVTIEEESGGCFPIGSKTTPVSGSVIGVATPINTLSNKGKLSFKVTATEEQAVTKFEGITGKDELEAFGFVKTGLEAEPEIEFAVNEELIA